MIRQKRTVGILVYENTDILDFTGPSEVFSLTARTTPEQGWMLYKKEIPQNRPYHVKTITADGDPVTTHPGIRIIPDYSFSNHPKLDILIVPGASLKAVDSVRRNPELLDWICRQQREVEILGSVCTGAFLLAESGVLDGKKAATHHMASGILARKYPRVQVQKGARIVDEGQIVTSGGVSSGIHMALHIVERHFGAKTADRTAKVLEFHREREDTRGKMW